MEEQSECTQLESIDEDSVFKILVCTDTHLGYKENHRIIGKDSFNTLEEIMEM